MSNTYVKILTGRYKGEIATLKELVEDDTKASVVLSGGINYVCPVGDVESLFDEAAKSLAKDAGPKEVVDAKLAPNQSSHVPPATFVVRPKKS